HYLLADHILARTEVGPVPVGQGKVGNITDLELVSPCRFGLVEQAVGGAAQPVGGISRARRRGLGLQRLQTSSAHGLRRAAAAYHSSVYVPQMPGPAPFPKPVSSALPSGSKLVVKHSSHCSALPPVGRAAARDSGHAALQ
nr:hypothetical protein [Tanacetum cinerariifolium]